MVERLGGYKGGIIAMMPSNIVPALVGIRLSAASDAAFRTSCWSVPPSCFGNVMCLWVWRLLPPHLPPSLSLPRRLLTISAASLLVWLCLALAVKGGMWYTGAGETAAVVVGTSSLCFHFAFGCTLCANSIPSPPGTAKVTLLMKVLRFSFMALAVFTGVLLAKLGHSTAAAVASVFPGIFLTTMVSTWIAQGEAVPMGAVGPMSFGSLATSAYAVIYCYISSATSLLPITGSIYLAAFLSYITASLCITLPVSQIIRRLRERNGSSLLTHRSFPV